ncbi:MAG: hypothetical protein GX902_00020 [Lentisphaerae bacterium]|nr:hypothetical protein [Lentisphaerota bacterium]
MMKFFLSFLFFAGLLSGQTTERISVSAALSAVHESEATLTLTLAIPATGYLYAEQFILTLPPGVESSRSGGLEPAVLNPADGPVYAVSGDLQYRLKNLTWPLPVTVEYTACIDGLCFLPATRKFLLTADAGIPAAGQPVADAGGPAGVSSQAEVWLQQLAATEVLARTSGYLNKEAFLAWLQQGVSGEAPAPEDNFLSLVFKRYGLFLAALLVIPLGLLLNLTPCVLPMIPINLSIIGARASDGGGRWRGLWLGGLYGLAMAAVYGGLGAVVVLTGARFGAINSSPWFNLIIALIFVFLGLAMFDVILLDFSRFRKGGTQQRSQAWLTALILGAVSALLAGACVAPVLIWVLLLATDLHLKGNPAGIFLPLLLGLGMALPWPLLGAGISHLPKPGSWMVQVKKGFGILILLVAGYYLFLGITLFRQQSGSHSELLPGWQSDLLAALHQAKQENKLVLLDFWGATCKSCLAMHRAVLQEPEVVDFMEPLVKVSFQSDAGNDPLVQTVLKHYQVIGLPTYILLRP